MAMAMAMALYQQTSPFFLEVGTRHVVSGYLKGPPFRQSLDCLIGGPVTDILNIKALRPTASLMCLTDSLKKSTADSTM
jgi:hypothetical protein